MNRIMLAAFLLAPLCGARAYADAPEQVRIKHEARRNSGSGCPAGTVSAALSPDKQALTLLFSQYYVQAGPDVNPHEGKKDCRIDVPLDFPDGWTWSVASVDYRGYVSLEPQAWADLKASYKFKGSGNVPMNIRLTGPLEQDYAYRQTATARGWAKCRDKNDYVTIDTQIHAGGAHRARALLTVDSVDHAVQQTYHIEWRRCQ